MAANGGLTWRIEIFDSEFVGSETEFSVENGARKEYRGDGDSVFSPILGSSLAFQMMIEDTTHEALITDLAGAPEGRFTVVLYREGVFDWAGVINSPEISIEDLDYPYAFAITAVDGLALLKNYEYRQDGTDVTKWDLRYTGIDSLIDIVFRVLQKLPHVVTHFTGSTKFLVSAVNWYAEQHDTTPVAAAYDPLYYTEIDNRFAVTGQSSGNAKFLSCYDVLSYILRAFGARVGLFDGYFLIEQVEHRFYVIGSNDNYSRYYAYDGTGPTANTLTASQDVGLAEDIKIHTSGTFSFERPIKSARVTQNINALQNLLSGAYFDSGTVETVTVENVFADGTNSYIRFTGNLEWTFENLGVGAPGDIIFIARFRLKMLFDAKYAVRVVTYDNSGGWTVTSVSWSGSLGYIEIPIVLTVPPLTETWTGQTKIDFLFPNASDFVQGDTEFSFEFIEINYYFLGAETLLDPSDYNLDWTLRDPYCGIVLNPKKIKLSGLPPGVANPKTVTYEVYGGDTNTQTEYIDTFIGDKAGTVTNQWGGLLFNNAGTYEYTEAWGSRNGTRNRPIAQLLAKRTVEFYYYPKKIFRGIAIGTDFSCQIPIAYNGTTYFLKGGSLQTDRDEFSGEWVEIDFTAAELVYGPAEYDTGEYEKTSAGGGGSGGGGGNVDNGGAGSGTGSPGGGCGCDIQTLLGNLPTYVNDDDAITGGLFTGDWYVVDIGNDFLPPGIPRRIGG